MDKSGESGFRAFVNGEPIIPSVLTLDLTNVEGRIGEDYSLEDFGGFLNACYLVAPRYGIRALYAADIGLGAPTLVHFLDSKGWSRPPEKSVLTKENNRYILLPTDPHIINALG